MSRTKALAGDCLETERQWDYLTWLGRDCKGRGVISEDSLPVASLQAQGPVAALDEDQDNRLPADQPPHPVQQLPVHYLRLLPGVGEHPLEVHLLVTVGAGLFLTNNAPATDTELERRELLEFY